MFCPQEHQTFLLASFYIGLPFIQTIFVVLRTAKIGPSRGKMAGGRTYSGSPSSSLSPTQANFCSFGPVYIDSNPFFFIWTSIKMGLGLKTTSLKCSLTHTLQKSYGVIFFSGPRLRRHCHYILFLIRHLAFVANVVLILQITYVRK